MVKEAGNGVLQDFHQKLVKFPEISNVRAAGERCAKRASAANQIKTSPNFSSWKKMPNLFEICRKTDIIVDICT